MSKETKNNYCGLAVINDELLFVCTNKVTTIWDCKYKKLLIIKYVCFSLKMLVVYNCAIALQHKKMLYLI